MPDIIELAENEDGMDYIIGDIHGELSLLNNFIKLKLGRNDRLFLVGDLTERGENSLGVLELLQNIESRRQELNLPQQIFAVKGNHECMFSEYVRTKLWPGKYDEQTRNQIKKIYFENGGKWIEGVDENTLHSVLPFVESLPVIMRVSGASPFNVVHADLPFSNDELSRRLREGRGLTENEVKHATWARPEKTSASHQDSSSIPTYCGHEILGGLREGSNHINLDVGSFNSRQLCVVNHTLGCCDIFDERGFLSDFTISNFKLWAAKNEINRHINFRFSAIELLKDIQKNTGMFPSLNQKKIDLLFSEARNDINDAPSAAEVRNVVVKLVRDLIAIKSSTMAKKLIKEFARSAHGKMNPIKFDEIIKNEDLKNNSPSSAKSTGRKYR